MRRRKKSTLVPYFAYGSNLNLDGMRHRCPDARPIGPAKLEGWKLVFRGVADIVESSDVKDVVHGGVWLVSPRDVEALDRYEGYPRFYTRKQVPVRMHDGEIVLALVYVMNTTDRIDPPSQFYLNTILEGFRAFGLPRDPIDRALLEVEEDLQRRGVTHVVPDGRKRMRGIVRTAYNEDTEEETWEKYIDPEDEPELPICEECEMVGQWDFVEGVFFCPDCGEELADPNDIETMRAALNDADRFHEIREAVQRARREVQDDV